ncbi:MAG: formate dehydrogenase accessory sulfurtransferase FdhD, partial [Bacteroidota bacterium]
SQIISTTEQATFGGNVILVRLSPNVTIELQKLERHFYTSSSCGVCGKSSIAAVHQSGALKLKDEGFHLPARLLPHLPERVRQQQLLFAETGGIHAAGLLDQDGKVLMVQEDVGRHNAVDKLIGQALLNQQLPLHHSLLLLSGRVSFELIQKALMAGIPMVAAVGAPSTLAIQLAKDSNMTVVGFLRNGAFNVYCGAERVSA